MYCENNATRLRRQTMISLAQAFSETDSAAAVARVPVQMRPRDQQVSRCCVHKDRAILRARLISLLGFDSSQDDELTPLSDFMRDALQRTTAPEPGLCVNADACNGCVKSCYQVTNACRGCLARPCATNCPKQAINASGDRAVIDPDRCVDCGLCQRVCPYHAVVRIPVPCEEVCPVGAISSGESGLHHIDAERCIHCGQCVRACPFGAVLARSHMVDVMRELAGARPVVALVAPAIAGQLPGTLEQISGALRRLGFAAVLPVACGAEETAAHEAEELHEVLESGAGFLTSSCCPGWVAAARRHLTDFADHVSQTPSPMHYAAAASRQRWPDACTVFIGPCLAKMWEAADDAMVDCVLTFEEIAAMLVAGGVEVGDCDPVPLEGVACGAAWGFAASGGVSGAVRGAVAGLQESDCVVVNGLDSDGLKVLRRVATGATPARFVEVMACQEGCLGGPGVVVSPKLSRRRFQAVVTAASS